MHVVVTANSYFLLGAFALVVAVAAAFSGSGVAAVAAVLVGAILIGYGTRLKPPGAQ